MKAKHYVTRPVSLWLHVVDMFKKPKSLWSVFHSKQWTWFNLGPLASAFENFTFVDPNLSTACSKLREGDMLVTWFGGSCDICVENSPAIHIFMVSLYVCAYACSYIQICIAIMYAHSCHISWHKVKGLHHLWQWIAVFGRARYPPQVCIHVQQGKQTSALGTPSETWY